MFMTGVLCTVCGAQVYFSLAAVSKEKSIIEGYLRVLNPFQISPPVPIVLTLFEYLLPVKCRKNSCNASGEVENVKAYTGRRMDERATPYMYENSIH